MKHKWNQRLAVLIIGASIAFAYSNHFHNGFHYDDSHTIAENPWIRDIRNLPRFFADGTTFSVTPPNRSYRPLVTASLAIDYWIGGSLDPLWFHVSTFFWFLIQLACMLALFRNILKGAFPEPVSFWIALFGVAVYGLHPATAETINYVIQRGDVHATLGVVAGLVWYVLFPDLRRFHLYLLPVIAGVFSKPPAAAFPLILLLWLVFFEDLPLLEAFRRTIPDLAITGTAAYFTVLMTPPTFYGGAHSAYSYFITQPAVLFDYFREFFAPLHLTINSSRTGFDSLLRPGAIVGILFVACLLWLAWRCSRRPETKPVAFGLFWFLIASLPTSLIPLDEFENDHRMYFPFVGLALAAAAAGALALRRWRVPGAILLSACAVILAAAAYGTVQRNAVWSTDESLWRDVVAKSPENGRGLVNYGLALLAKGDNAGALTVLERARAVMPDFFALEMNLGNCWAALDNPVEATHHYVRAIELAPAIPQPKYAYAVWLIKQNREDEAAELLRSLLRSSPDYMDARHLLLQIYARSGETGRFESLLSETFVLFPADTVARDIVRQATAMREAGLVHERNISGRLNTEERWLGRALTFSLTGQFDDCIHAANEALQLNRASSDTWGRIASCQYAKSDWGAAEKAAREAIRLNPGLQGAKQILESALARSGQR